MYEYRHPDGTLCPHPHDTPAHAEAARALGCTGRAWKITRPGMGFATGGPLPVVAFQSGRGLMQLLPHDKDHIPASLDRGDFVVPATALKQALSYIGHVYGVPSSILGTGAS